MAIKTIYHYNFIIFSVGIAVFHLYTAYVGGGLIPLVTVSIHVGLMLAAGFMIFDYRGKSRLDDETGSLWSYGVDAVLALASLAICYYVVANSNRFLFSLSIFPSRATGLDHVVSAFLLLLVFEASRRIASLSFAILGLIVFAYALFGDVVPGHFGINPFSLSDILIRLLTTNVGVFGSITGVSATEIAVLILFAGMVIGLGGLDILRDAAIVIAGRSTGGAGKVSIALSAIVGTFMGSSAANVASTGSLTIPMMIGRGYSHRFAAGLEAASSTFGQIMPPIMGTGAFIMAELVGISVVKIMAAALLPAFVIYFAIFSATHFYAASRGLHGLPPDMVRAARERISLLALTQVVLPMVVLIGMLAFGRSIPTSAFYAYCSAFLVHIVIHSGDGLVTILSGIRRGLLNGMRSLVTVAILIIVSQVIVSLVNLTSIGVTLMSFVTGGSGLTALGIVLLTAVAALVLGMGLPTTGAYVVTASIAVPLLETAGFPALNSHIFVFFFAILSAITPPVCVAVYVAAGLAKTPWLSVAGECFRISIVKYILPFVILYNSALILEGDTLEIALVAGVTIAGAVAIEALFYRYFFGRLSRLEVVIGLPSGVALLGTALVWNVIPTQYTVMLGVVGACSFLLMGLVNWRGGRASVTLS